LTRTPVRVASGEQSDKTPSSYTIENMPEGTHVIGVTAVDRAGNEIRRLDHHVHI